MASPSEFTASDAESSVALTDTSGQATVITESRMMVRTAAAAPRK